MNPDAEKNLRAGLDAARDEYEEKLAGVRATYFSQIEMLHKKLAKDQQAAVDVYHGEVRGELTDVLRKLRPLVDDEAMGAEVPTSMLKSTEVVADEDAQKWREFLSQPKEHTQMNMPVHQCKSPVGSILAAPLGEPDVRLAPPEASGFFTDEPTEHTERAMASWRSRFLPRSEPKPAPRHYG